MSSAKDPDLIQSTPVLATLDYPRAKVFWTEALGFDCIEEGGDPAKFGIFRRGRAIVFVDGWTAFTPPQNCWSAYFHTNDLDGIRREMLSRSAAPTDIRDTVYGMREFEVIDPDGHILCFGQDIPNNGD